MTSTDVTTPTTVASRDGTPIAYWTLGDGPPLLLVHGMTSNHATFDPALPYLTPHVSVHSLDRRGRGGSGDTDLHDLEREYEDIAAVIDHLADTTGSRVDLLGHSFGGLCAFGAVQRTANVRRLILYEGWPVPDPTVILGADGVMDRVEKLLGAGDDEAALAAFYREVVGMSDGLLLAFRSSSKWPDRVAAAPTIPREVSAQSTGILDPVEAAGIDVPVLLLVGEDSPNHLRAGVGELVAALPDAHVAELEGQQHLAYLEAPELFAQTVLSFLRPDQGPDQRNGG
jgi:pimeloyl-ACP methyl ester carboxylesterase